MRQCSVSADSSGACKSKSARVMRGRADTEYADQGRADRAAPVCMKNKEESKMNEVERLAKNIKVFIETGCLEEEMRTIAEENPHLDDLGELNDIMETEIGYFGD